MLKGSLSDGESPHVRERFPTKFATNAWRSRNTQEEIGADTLFLGLIFSNPVVNKSHIAVAPFL